MRHLNKKFKFAIREKKNKDKSVDSRRSNLQYYLWQNQELERPRHIHHSSSLYSRSYWTFFYIINCWKYLKLGHFFEPYIFSVFQLMIFGPLFLEYIIISSIVVFVTAWNGNFYNLKKKNKTVTEIIELLIATLIAAIVAAIIEKSTPVIIIGPILGLITGLICGFVKMILK